MGRAPYSTDETTVSHTADIGATVTTSAAIGSAPVTPEDGADPAQVALAAGMVTTITVAVAAEDGTTARTAIGTTPETTAYMVMVYRENLPPSDIASLAAEETGLVLSTLGLDGTPASIDSFTYVPADRSYPNVRVGNDVQVLTVTANPAQGGAVTVITPSDQDSLIDGHQVILRSAAKTDITIEVTAEDGITTDTYSVTVYRERLSTSDDVTLSALSLSDVTLSPAFASDRPKYTGSAAYGIEMITVSYTADVGAMVAIHDGSDTVFDMGFVAAPPNSYNDDDPTAPGHQVLLEPTGNATVITIAVRAEDGATVTTEAEEETPAPYKITIYRDPAPSSDATLQTLELSGITLSPAFDPATTEYTAEVEEALSTTTVEAMATHLRATVEGTGLKSLTAGVDNTISVTVTAEDGTSQIYTVKVTVPSSDATLQTLALSGITLSPAFNPATMEYTGEVEFTVRTTTVVATPAHPDATVMGTGETSLSEGDNTISVTVTAEDGTSQETYTVMVTVSDVLSPVATLQALELSDIALSPAFDSTTTEYAAEVEYTVETTTVVAMPTHPGATVEGDGPQSLSEGENTISVTVTAEDGTSQETYTVTVTVVARTLLERYDANNSNQIEKGEALTAIDDYLIHGTLTKEEVLDVINLYLFG